MKKSLPKLLALLMAIICISNKINAQWLYSTPLEIKEDQNISRTNYPVVLDIDTKSLIEAKLMNENASDLRLSLACESSTFLPYWIESGINSNHTLVWVKIASLPANGSIPLYLRFGNPSATSASSKSGMFADSLIISANRSLTPFDTVFQASFIEIKNSTISFGPGHSGTVKFKADYIKINSSATLNGDGAGNKGGAFQQDGTGAGKGGGAKTNLGGGGGGAGYGGNGGIGCGSNINSQGKPGAIFGTDQGTDIAIGSGGGGGDQTLGGDGGGAFIFNAQEINNAGTISVKGTQSGETSGSGGGGGGGSGGGILMFAKNIVNTGSINISGGNGNFAGNWPGGGGAGGRLKFAFLSHAANQGSVKLDGGKIGPPFDDTDPAAAEGEKGKISFIKLNKAFIADNPSTLLKLTPKKDPIVEKESLTLTASGTYENFDFYQNGNLEQSGTDSVFTSKSPVKNGDRFVVKNYAAGNSCILVSEPFVATVNIVNIAPNAKDDVVAIEQNSLDFIINVLKNDIDANSNIDSSLLIILEEPKNGTVYNGGIGEFIYTPKDNYIGKDVFQYKIFDKMGLSDSAFVYITVYDPSAGNVKPTANPDNAKVLINTQDTVDVLANDIDPDGTLVLSTLKLKVPPGNGTAEVVAGTSLIVYTPNNNYLGEDLFQYEICDDGNPSLCSTAIVNILVENSIGIKNAFENNFDIYPNPSNQFLNIKFKNNVLPESYKIHSNIGALIRNVKIDQASDILRISTENLKSGIYLIEINTSNQRFTKWFIKQ